MVNNQPQRVMDDRNGLGPQGGYIGKITNDARETEMEENMGQVNTMIGNLRNMAIDMGSELENQNRQIDRINRKVRRRFARPSVGLDMASIRRQAGHVADTRSLLFRFFVSKSSLFHEFCTPPYKVSTRSPRCSLSNSLEMIVTRRLSVYQRLESFQSPND